MNKPINFTHFYEDIFHLLPNGNIQEFMNLCYKYTGVPIIIVDILYNVLGTAPGILGPDEIWNYLLEHRAFDNDKITLMYTEGIINSVDMHKSPYVVDWGVHQKYPKLLGIVKIGDSVEAYVCFDCSLTPITDELFKAMEIIQDVCAYFLKKTNAESNMTTLHQKIFATELVNDRIHNKKDLEKWFYVMNCKINPPYIIAVTEANEDDGKHILSLIRKSCQTASVNQLMLIQDNILYTICCQFELNSHITQEFLQNFQQTCQRFHAKTGFSMPFDNLLDFSTYKYQAETALKLGNILSPPESEFHYQDYFLPALIYPAIEKMEPVSYIHPLINSIMLYDSEHNTELFLTLKTYILSLQNTAKTAEILHIHRNTLLYRIHKIEELFHISLTDYKTILHLMLSFYMLDLIPE